MGDWPRTLSPVERAEGRLALWNLRAFKRVAAFSLAGDPALHCLAWARDGRTLLAAGADGCARLLDVASRAEVGKRTQQGLCVGAYDTRNLLHQRCSGWRRWLCAPAVCHQPR